MGIIGLNVLLMQKRIKKTVTETCVLLSIAITTALAVNHFSPAGIALVGQWDESEGVITANAKNGVVASELEIKDVKIAKQIHDSGKAVFVDARNRENFEDGHIPGSVSLPVGQFDESIDSFMNQYSPDRPLVTYCSGRTCEDSHRLAQLLFGVGFNNVKVFIDGFPGWEAEGYPVE